MGSSNSLLTSIRAKSYSDATRFFANQNALQNGAEMQVSLNLAKRWSFIQESSRNTRDNPNKDC